MNDIRRTILWVIFGFSMVLLWDQWQVYNGHKATFFPTPGQVAATAKAPVSAASGVPVASAGGSSALPTSAAQSPAQVPGTSAPAASAPRERIVVTTDVFKLTFDTEGGSLVQAEFVLKYMGIISLPVGTAPMLVIIVRPAAFIATVGACPAAGQTMVCDANKVLTEFVTPVLHTLSDPPTELVV